jgi:hypothetical protein
MLEVGDMLAFGNQCITSLVDEQAREKMLPWLDLLRSCLASAGGIDGTLAQEEQSAIPRKRAPYVYDSTCRR